MPRLVDVTPSASRLSTSLRDIGYTFTTALADVVDNSIAAQASMVEIDFVFDGDGSHIVVADDGHGMSGTEVEEALRFGSRRTYAEGDLGRFGLGLKTATLSQCRRVTVTSRRALQRRLITKRTLDLDHVVEWDKWQIYDPQPRTPVRAAMGRLNENPGTVVLLEKLDRLFEGVDANSGWGRRRLDKLASEAAAYLAMVFHRFIEGDAASRVTIVLNGEKLRPWNPFAPGEQQTRALPPRRFHVNGPSGAKEVMVRPFILPPKASFSTAAEFDRLAGPNRWNRQQGLYIYRADRLVQAGGWAGLRAVDEHTKLARLAVDFPTSLDEQFKINVAKMKVTIPGDLRPGLLRVVNETCVLANAAYRRGPDREENDGGSANSESVAESTPIRSSQDARVIGLALQVAALEAGEEAAYDRILSVLREADPVLADRLSG